MSDSPLGGTTGVERARYVRVAVNSGRPVDQAFTYRVPVGREVAAGEVVHVPWGPRTLQGVVVEGPMDVGGYPAEQTRALEPPVEGAPRIDEVHLALAAWIRAYYLAPAWETYALMLPPGAGERPRTGIARGGAPSSEADLTSLTPRQRLLFGLLTEEAEDLDDLRERFGEKGFSAALTPLLRRGLAERRYSLGRPRGRARVVEVVCLLVPPEAARAYIAALPGRRSSRRSRALRAVIEAAGELPEKDVARIARGAPAVETLVKAGLLRREGEPGAPRIHLALSPAETEEHARALSYTRDEAATASVLARLIEAEGGTTRLPELLHDLGRGTREAVAALEGAGLVRVEEELDRRDPLREVDVARRVAPELIAEQRQAAERIRAAIDRADGAQFLLQGVTGSGKTEVYLDALDHAVGLGRRAIVMVPEIALTPQTVRRFAERFPGRVGVLHSGLPLGEAFDEWHRVAAGAYDVVVGSRSAVFAPQPNLGLIIIDESHEWTYKQHEPAPRYDSRTVAARLAETTGATVVYGTATPDAEHWYAASRGEIERIDLPRRVRVVPQPLGPPLAMPWAELPDVEVVDMRGARSLFSPALVAALAETLDRDEQAILLLNRRGRAAFLLCLSGHSPTCPACDVAFTLHDPLGDTGPPLSRRGRLVCHQCNRSRAVPAACLECGLRLARTRAGTQEVEREVKFHFLTARVLRWDSDTARNVEQHTDHLRSFAAHEADVLVGTQMVAKGLDLPLVTLVGVVLADYSLREGDFRAGERTLQLLEQVAGRAGRAERNGRVIIQTLRPEEPAIQAVAHHDVDGFFEAELPRRAKYGFPPFRRLARLLVAHEHGDYAREEAGRIATELLRRAAALPGVDVRGPSPSSIPRLRGRYRWQILVFAPNPLELVSNLDLSPAWSIDIDPVVVT
ncbi:MAG: primosomal protein N' [Dehalococcoidia bacterium]|nr:primosomal protein N' [Dehalococcoidia bacterium]